MALEALLPGRIVRKVGPSGQHHHGASAGVGQVFRPPALATGRWTADQREMGRGGGQALATPLHVAQGCHGGGGDPIEIAENPIFEDGGQHHRKCGDEKEDKVFPGWQP